MQSGSKNSNVCECNISYHYRHRGCSALGRIPVVHSLRSSLPSALLISMLVYICMCCVYACMYMYMYICVCMYMYVCMYVYIHCYQVTCYQYETYYQVLTYSLFVLLNMKYNNFIFCSLFN